MVLKAEDLKVLPLAQILDRQTREGELYERLPEKALRCYACGHRCLIRDGRRGICKVRFNRDGTLYVPWGYVAALQCDPTEKKPFYHMLPGSHTLTFGMLGCDYHCPYCQNWLTSQALRDPAAGARPESVSPKGLVDLALRSGARLVGSSYNEPLITAEWAVAIFQEAKTAGLKTCFISNGNGTEQVLTYLRPWCDGYKIDLKSMSQKNYRYLGGVLEHVLETVQMVHAVGFWLEVVTLIVPGWNDSDEELTQAAEFLVSISPDIPWHVTAFHKDYKMTDPDHTRPETLLRAARIGQSAGLRYVYAGNLPGRVGKYENTYCPTCKDPLIARFGFLVTANRLTPDGSCPSCHTPIPGIWS
ncbi:MAG: pyruvate formate-lyase activating enzyme [candidate division NC10 bacterium CSP1-5]|nr:MAG: pyruvate formate-lyase activating enzyme [candidate division NC10 bacterium CSP1-5]